jgi:hypothetical protein
VIYWAYADTTTEPAEWRRLEAETVWGVLCQLEGFRIHAIHSEVDAESSLEDQLEAWKTIAQDREDFWSVFS